MEQEEVESFVVSEGEAGVRLDKLLADHYTDVKSRTYFQDLIEKEMVLLNGQVVKKRICPKAGDLIEIQFLLTPEIHVVGENISLNVIYEDESIIVINKPPGMVVHPAPGNWTGTLVNALLFHCKELGEVKPTSIKDPLPRPGIVHRLDKDTSGVIIAAKQSQAHQKLVSLFGQRLVEKEYAAICVGNPGVKTIDAPIDRDPIRRKEMRVVEEGGRNAVTRCESLAFNGKLSLVKLKPITGRTHQLRVHLKHNNTPILGDPVYGSTSANRINQAPRLMLHAKAIAFPHPMTGKQLCFEAPIPDDMQVYIRQIEGKAR